MALVEPISSRSKDPNTHVGCVVVGPDNEIRSTGYNSFPRGIRDDVPARLERPEKYLWMEHAERNACYAAGRVGIPLAGCRIYQDILPCMDCGRAIVQCGIVEVIFNEQKQAAYSTSEKYGPEFARVRVLFEEAGVMLTPWSPPVSQ